jgi:phosphoserine phosphatase RsbU/P
LLVPGLDLYGTSKLGDLGGTGAIDFIDLARSREGHLLLAIGELHGQSIGSAMLVASARGALRASLQDNQLLDVALERVNRTFTGESGVIMTLLLMRISGDSGEIVFSSAGHDPGFIYDPDSNEFTNLVGMQHALGKLETVDYRMSTHRGFKSGQVLVLTTTGIIETRSATGEEFGAARLQELIRRNALRPAVQIGRELESALSAFRGTTQSSEDVTYIVVRAV